jgi:integrase
MPVVVRPWAPKGRAQRWQVDVQARRADGSKVRDRRVIEGTQTAAKAWGERRQAVLLGEIHAPVEAPRTGKVLTMAEWAPTFHRHYQGRKPSAADSAKGIVETHIVQHIGSVRLDHVNQSVADKLEATWRAGGYPELKRDRVIKGTSSTKTINNRKTVLISILKYALECSSETGLTSMPCRVRLAKVDGQRAPKFYEVVEYARIVEAASKDKQALAVVLMGGDAGMRVSEMLSLKRADIRGGKITIRTSVYERTSGNRIEGDTKGGKEKTLPMTKRLVAALEAVSSKGDYVLHYGDGSPLTWRAVTWIIRKIERAAGLPVTGHVHIYRHTYCSHLAMANVPARQIMELARHTDLATSLKYMHLAKDGASNAVHALEELRQ